MGYPLYLVYRLLKPESLKFFEFTSMIKQSIFLPQHHAVIFRDYTQETLRLVTGVRPENLSCQSILIPQPMSLDQAHRLFEKEGYLSRFVNPLTPQDVQILTDPLSQQIQVNLVNEDKFTAFFKFLTDAWVGEEDLTWDFKFTWKPKLLNKNS